MTVLYSLLAALGYGVCDFVAGLASRRTSAWPITVTSTIGAASGMTLMALFLPGHPSTTDLLWGSVAGLGSGMGSLFLYRGLAAGSMGVVAPISAVGAAVLPVIVGVLIGERPTLLVWLGIATALPAIWLVAREPGVSAGSAAGVLDGVLAGVGFGVLFAATGQISATAGYWPLTLAQVVGGIAVVGAAVLLGQPWKPRARTDLWGLVAGLLAAAAMLAFFLATQHGQLAVAGVLTSLYPAATVALAVIALRERVHLSQGVGLLLSALAVTLVAMG